MTTERTTPMTHTPRSIYRVVLTLFLLSLAGCAAPAPRPAISPQRAAQLPREYDTAVRALIPGMGAEQIERRRESQLAFERICLAAARPGAEHERSALCSVIAARLGPDTPPPARVWMLRQLAVIGGDESVDALAALLSDPDAQVREHARQALQQNPSPRAGEALIAALAGASDPADQVAYINALAARGDGSDEPVAAIEPHLRAGGPVGAAAISAMGTLGGKRPITNLNELLKSEDETERNAAAAALVRAADALVERNITDWAAIIYQDVYKFPVADEHRLAAVRGLAKTDGGMAFRILFKSIRREQDEQWFAEACRIAAPIPGRAATSLLAQACLEAKSPDDQIVLIAALTERDDDVKYVFINLLESEHEPVRIAAIRALKVRGDNADVQRLAAAAAHATGEEQAAARDALASLSGKYIDSTLQSSVKAKFPPEVKAEFIRAMAARHYTRAVPLLLRLAAGDEEPLRAPAYEALAELGDAVHLPAVIDTLGGTMSEETRTAAEDAVVALCGKDQGEEAPTDPAKPVLAAYARADGAARASLVRILGRVGGDEALRTLRAAAADASSEVRDAAVRALAAWPTTDVLDDLLALAASAPQENLRVLALRGYVRLLRLPNDRTPGQTLELLQKAMAAAARDEERREVLAAVGEVPTVEALRYAGSHLSVADGAAQPALRDEAAAAMLSIARSLCATDYDAAHAAVSTVLGLPGLDPQSRTYTQAQEASEYIEHHRGYIVRWRVAGPFHRENVTANDLFDVSFPPEQDAAGVTWTVLEPNNAAKPWLFDLVEAMGGDNRCLYLSATVESSTEQPAVLEVGSDDCVKVWLNGEQVHAARSFRPLTEAEDKVDVTLQPGANMLLLKVVQGSGGCGVACGVVAPANSTLAGLRIAP